MSCCLSIDKSSISQKKVLQPLTDKLRHHYVAAYISLVFSGFRKLVVVWEAHVVVLQPVEAVHHVGATCIHFGVLALVSYFVWPPPSVATESGRARLDSVVCSSLHQSTSAHYLA